MKPEQLRSVVWPLIVKHNDGTREPQGSATVVGALGRHALLITAGHTLSAILRKDQQSATKLTSTPHPNNSSVDREHTWENVSLEVLATNEKGDYETCSVSHAGFSESTDAAILFVDVPEKSKHFIDTALPIRSLGPDVGEQIHAVGYFDFKDVTDQCVPPFIPEEVLGDLVGQFFDSKMSLFKGKVLATFEDGITINRWPCFQVSTPFHSGMSGGAVISVNSDGRLALCGVISSDISRSDANKEHGSGEHAISSKIYPMLGMNFGEKITYSYNENGTLVTEEKGNLFDFLDGVAVVDIDNAQDHLQFAIGDDGLLRYEWRNE